MVVRNAADTPVSAAVSSDWGTVAPAVLDLPAKGRAAIALCGSCAKDTEVVLTVSTGPGTPAASRRVLLVADGDLTDYRDLSREVYKDESYYWLNHGDLTLRLKTQRGKDHTLSLYWGAKNDERVAKLTIGGETQVLKHGGYDGYEWLDVAIPAKLVTGNVVEITLAKPDEGSTAFIGRVKVKVNP